MALPNYTLFHDKFDFVNSVLQQTNMCPICHLPLVFDRMSDTAKTMDNIWCNIVKTMKNGVSKNSNFYGYIGNKTNTEKCHFVSKTMVMEVQKTPLYESPAVGGVIYPDKNLYLKPELLRSSNEKLFDYDFMNLFYNVNDIKIKRALSFFNMSATKFFYGCKDCNAVHTAFYQVRAITISHYLLHPPLDNTPSCVNMYTLLFDCMAECDNRSNRIVANADACQTWLLRVWIYYCTIMFYAQNEAAHNRSKLHVDYRKKKKIYFFHYAPRDMGLCDYYMSQILCGFLYANFYIEYDYLTLHQFFFCRLAFWAEKENLFQTVKFNYRALWRMVMGCDETSADPLPICTDLATNASNTLSYQQAQNEYWLHPNQKPNICTKIQRFVSTWIDVIGNVMQTYSQLQDVGATEAAIDTLYPTQNQIVKNLFQFYYNHCVVYYAKRKNMIGFSDAVANTRYFDLFALHPKISTIKTMFHDQMYNQSIWYNYMRIALPRHRAVLHLFNHVADDPNNNDASSQILTKYNRIQNLTLELITI